MAKAAKAPGAQGTGFWDQPGLMNLLSDLLLLFAGAALTYAAVSVAQRLPFFALRQVVVDAPLHQVTRMQVEYAVADAVNGNFFTVDPDAVRTAFEKLPWVRRAEVRRRWPDTLELGIEEQIAVARWHQQDGESRLVNTEGEVFPAAAPGELPILAGPEGRSAEVLARYREFDQALLPLGRKVSSLSLSLREAWQVKLDNGLVLDLGRDQTRQPVDARLARFISNYPELERKLGAEPAAIDTRYPNGFAVRLAHAGKTS